MLLDPTSLALGEPRNDVWNHVWGYWYVADSLGDGQLPVHTDLLVWPGGGSLWFIDLLGALVTLPVQWVAGPIAAYNASYFLNWMLCGLGAYALGLQVTESRAAALVAGLAYMSTPQLLGQAYNGISETLAAGWLPLALLALRHGWEKPNWRSGALVGLVYGITALANWYYGLFAALVALGLLLREPFTRRRSRWKGLAWMLGAAAMVGTLVVAQPFWVFLSTLGAEDAIVTRESTFNWSTLVLHNMTDVLALVHPGKFYSPDLHESFGENLIVVVYLGHALLLPALAGLWLRWRRARWWGAMALGFTVLTLGPFLYINGDYLQIAGGWVPLPFLALFEHAPGFSTISHAYRFAIGASLALCVLAAVLVAELESRGINGWMLAILLSGARIAESFWASPAWFPIPAARAEIPEVYTALEGGAVWDLPIGIPVLARSEYSLFQITHGQPVPYGLNEHMPKLLWANRFSRYLVEMEWSDVATMPAQPPWLDLELGRTALIDDGLRWIVLHKALYAEHQYPRVANFLDLVAEAVHDSEEIRVYRLQ